MLAIHIYYYIFHALYYHLCYYWDTGDYTPADVSKKIAADDWIVPIDELISLHHYYFAISTLSFSNIAFVCQITNLSLHMYEGSGNKYNLFIY